MPWWLRRQLEDGRKPSNQDNVHTGSEEIQTQRLNNEISGIIEVLSKLCDQDNSVKTAFLCHPESHYVSKTRWEGPNFCGYRNIQMLISYIRGATTPGHDNFPDGLPSIYRMQDLIEDAWDQGINSEGRTETGGIRGTRKHIGTPEVHANVFQLTSTHANV